MIIDDPHESTILMSEIVQKRQYNINVNENYWNLSYHIYREKLSFRHVIASNIFIYCLQQIASFTGNYFKN